MIASLEGKLVKLDSDSALIQVGAIGYEVLLPSYCVSAMAGKIGSDVALCTMEYYEGSPASGNLIPRIIGFLNPAERDFFNKFTSVKGVGIRKALRSLSIPIANIASAIETGDESILISLPGIGKRLASQMVAELKGKMQDFAVSLEAASSAGTQFRAFQAEALEILIAWGEKRNEAIELISLACKRHPDINTAEELVPLIYRLKQGIEV